MTAAMPDRDRLPRTIAIDGPAASGKSTLGRVLAERFGYRFLDTGFMYRAFALAAIRDAVAADDLDAVDLLLQRLDLRIDAGLETRIFLGDEDVTEKLREPGVERAVSAYSAIPAVRTFMVARQREVADEGLAVLAGRDIGTVVLPGAPLKFFLDASEDARARRRASQANGWGQDQAPDGAREDIAQRDRIDSSRATSPLAAAADAIRIDTTSLTLGQVVDLAVGHVWRLARAPEPASPRRSAFAGARSIALAPVRAWRWLRERLGWNTFVPLFYWACVHALRLVLFVVGRWNAVGRENIPAYGPLIVVSNHLNNADPPILASGIMRRRVRFMAKIELFRMPLGIIVRLYGAFAVRRFDADLAALLNAERLLKRGEVIGMFPEGTRSRTRTFGTLHPGTALIALRSGAPVLPCAIVGTEQLARPLNLLRKPRIQVIIGTPIAVEAVRRPTEAQVSDLTTRIHAAIAALLPPRYVPAYTESHGDDSPRE